MRNLRHILILAALSAALFCCTKQRDLYVVASPLVKIKCDWSRARIEPDVWTAMFYGDNTPTPKRFATSRTVDTLQLSPDNYKTLLVNGTLGGGIDFVAFRNTNAYDTFEAYATESQRKPNGDVVVNQPDTLAGTALMKKISGENKFAVKYIDGKLQPGQVNRFVSDSIEYVPCRLVYRINVIVTINNSNYLKASSRISGEVWGLAGGVLVASRMPTHSPVIYSLNFTNNIPSSATVSIVENAFATFGPPLDLTETRKYMVNLGFVLTNNKGYSVSTDVSDQVDVIIAKIKDRIDRGVCDAGLDLELRLEITLPEPDPEPHDGEISIDPWSGEENQNIPL